MLGLRSLKRALQTCLGFILCFAQAAGPAATRVICLGEGGRVAIEGSASSCSGDLKSASPSSPTDTSSARPSLEEPDCGPCDDVPIGTPGLSRSVVQHDAVAAAASNAVAVLPIDPASGRTGSAPNVPGPEELTAARTAATVSLRSTVLLI